MRLVLEKALYIFTKLFFYLLYHPLAWSYDIVSWIVSLGHWRSWIDTTLPYLTGNKVLELGYGPGHLQVSLLARGISTAGLDASRNMARITRNRLRRSGLPNSAAIGYVQLLPFSIETFDQVVATFPTDYIFEQETLEGVYRVLKPGGFLLVLPFAWLTGSRWYVRWIAKLFSVTHQAPSWDDGNMIPFIQAGFSTERILVDLDSSKVLLIKAKKIIDKVQSD